MIVYLRCATLLVAGVLSGCEWAPSIVYPSVTSIKAPEVYDGCDNCSLIARQIAWSIDNEPQLWNNKGYYIKRVDGGHIWVASGKDHLAIGPERWSTAKPPANDQALIWRAYVRWTKTEYIWK